jgi:hypothetical protein
VKRQQASKKIERILFIPSFAFSIKSLDKLQVAVAAIGLV